MTLMAGFDYVAEFSNAAVLNILKRELRLGDVSINPPFEISENFGFDAHFIVKDLLLDLNENDTLTLTFFFNRASVVLPPPMVTMVCSLDGDFTVTVHLQPVDATRRIISWSFDKAEVAIKWSSTANQEIISALKDTDYTPEEFTQVLRSALEHFIRQAPIVELELRSDIPFLQLEAHCISSSNRHMQALGIFGTSLPERLGEGNYKQKTSTAINGAGNDMCISIAPGAFRSLFFCPEVALALNSDVFNLPGSCGTSSGIDIGGVTLTSISESFSEGSININGSLYKAGTCYKMHGTFDGRVTLTISDNTVQPQITINEPKLSFDIKWYCKIALYILTGLPLLPAIFVTEVVLKVAVALAKKAFKSPLGEAPSGSGQTLGEFDASLTGVQITSEGLTAQGRMSLMLPPTSNFPKLNLDGNCDTLEVTEVAAGTVSIELFCPYSRPEPEDYPYTEYYQKQLWTYKLLGTMVSRPIQAFYSIYHDGKVFALDGQSGTVEIPGVLTLFDYSIKIVKPVQLRYTVKGTSIELINSPEDGSYRLNLRVTAKDCRGITLEDSAGSIIEATTQVEFRGQFYDIGGGYKEALDHCAGEMEALIKELAKQKYEREIPDISEKPGIDNYAESIRLLSTLPFPQAEEMLYAIKLAFGSSLVDAVLFDPTSKSLNVREKAEFDRRLELTRIARDLDSLTQAIRKIDRG